MEIKNTFFKGLPLFSQERIQKNTKENEFSSLLSDAIQKANKQQIISDKYKELLATGDVDNLHDITIAQEKANISLQLTLSIRNKVVEAYKEIMRMQI